MRRRATAALMAVVVAGVLLVAGCAADPEPSPSQRASQTAAPSPTPTALVVDPGARPPAVFGGDCSAALSVEQLAEATALDFAPRDEETGGSLANVGGLNCVWQGDAGSLVVQIIPQQGLVGAVFPADLEAYYFEDCDPNWVCSWQWESDDLWMTGSFQFVDGMTREKVDAWGAALGEQIAANHAANPDETWERNRTGWWPVIDCPGLGVTLAQDLQAQLIGSAGSYIDPPLPGFAMADIASHHSDCLASVIDVPDPMLRVMAVAGEAWVPMPEEFTPVDVGVAGIDVSLMAGSGPYGGAQYRMTDGVNLLDAEVKAQPPLTDTQVIEALARAAASGFE